MLENNVSTCKRMGSDKKHPNKGKTWRVKYVRAISWPGVKVLAHYATVSHNQESNLDDTCQPNKLLLLLLSLFMMYAF